MQRVAGGARWRWTGGRARLGRGELRRRLARRLPAVRPRARPAAARAALFEAADGDRCWSRRPPRRRPTSGRWRCWRGSWAPLYRAATAPWLAARRRSRYTDYVALAGAAALAGPRGSGFWEHWRRRLDGVPPLDLPDRPAAAAGADLARRRPPATARRPARRPPSGAGRGGAGRPCSWPCSPPSRRCSRAPRGQDDFLVGSPTPAGRHRAAAGRRGGLLRQPGGAARRPRGRSEASPSCSAAPARAALEALEHEDFPFALLAERLRPERDPAGRRSSRRCSCSRRAPGAGAGAARRLRAGRGGGAARAGRPAPGVGRPAGAPAAQFDLTLLRGRAGGRPRARPAVQRRPLRRRHGRADAGPPRRAAGCDGGRSGAAALPARPASPEPERAQLLAGATRAPGMREGAARPPARGGAGAARTPEAAGGGRCRGGRLTYGELERAGQPAGAPAPRLGVGPEDRGGGLPGALGERWSVALLAVLKAGAALRAARSGLPARSGWRGWWRIRGLGWWCGEDGQGRQGLQGR